MSSGTPSEDLAPREKAHRLERRKADRRQVPAACGLCELANPPYVYLEDGGHYCFDCALLVATTEQSYPAAWRAGDITLEELLRDSSILPPRVARDRRAPSSEYDLPAEPSAS